MATMMLSPVLTFPTFNDNTFEPTPICSSSSSSSSFHEAGQWDVICGRGQHVYNHSGNVFLRKLVEKQVHIYSSATTKAQRSTIVSDIVDTVRSMGRGFIKKEADGTWVEVGDVIAREKIGQAFRGALGLKYKSSNASKKRRRAATSSKFHQALHKIMISNTVVKQKTEEMAADAQQSAHLSDDAIMAMFSANNKFLLEGVIKTDQTLVDKFQTAFSAGADSEGDDESDD